MVPENSKLFFFYHRVRAPLQSVNRQRGREREPKTKGRVKENLGLSFLQASDAC